MAGWTVEDMQQMWTELAGPAEPTDAKGRKQRRILDAATELFVELGYRKTSVDEIARRAHVAKGTLYLYFPSKAHLLLGAVALEERAYAELMEPLLDRERPARTRLKEMLRMMLVLSQEMPLISRVMSGDQELAIALGEAEDVAPELTAKTDEFRLYFVAPLLNEAHGGTWSDAELDDRSRIFFGLLFFSGLLQRPEIRQGLPLERFAELLAEMLVDGIAVPDAPAPTARSTS
jgi:AcrR family transcriptional regulator